MRREGKVNLCRPEKDKVFNYKFELNRFWAKLFGPFRSVSQPASHQRRLYVQDFDYWQPFSTEYGNNFHGRFRLSVVNHSLKGGVGGCGVYVRIRTLFFFFIIMIHYHRVQ